MADVIIPVTDPATQKEARCFVCHGVNDLTKTVDPTLPGPELLAAIAAKYGFQIERLLEPQDSTGKKVAPTESLSPVWVPMVEALQRSFTAGGATCTGLQVLLLLNEIIDAYKGAGIPPQQG